MIIPISRIKKCIVCILLFIAGVSDAQHDKREDKLISQVGCAQCHSSLKIESDIKQKIPDLSYTADRYNEAHLYDFLKNPQTIRRHIGPARMPDFRLDDNEAVALVRFLATQHQAREPGIPFPTRDQGSTETVGLYQVMALEDTTCLSCHSLNGKGGVFAVDLATVGYRLKPDWMKQYLADPSLFDVPNTSMLAVFFQFSEARKRFVEFIPHAAERIHRIVDHLFSFNTRTKEQLQNNHETAEAAVPKSTAELGEAIFKSLNCTACHNHESILPSAETFAPDLSIEGFKVYAEWLRTFLEKPTPIRPFGFQPGSGSRMPDFQLSEGKVKTLSASLMNRTSESVSSWEAAVPQELTAFSMQKARLLLQDKLSCLGCHRMGEKGGKIGPDLSSVRQRLNPLYIYNQIKNPRAISPDAVMPQIPLQDKTLKLIFDFLFQQNDEREEAIVFSLSENQPILYSPQRTKEDNYLRYCAACHGSNGNGDGFNAPFILPAKPTVHSDSAYMSRRPDDTLFDGIYAGGYILNKHQFMPPWSSILSREEIKGLVARIRELCRCRGPEWSLDNQTIQ
ncbi:MAG: c-type cytochrome [bacterium]